MEKNTPKVSVIISLTSFPARIDTVNQTIETLLNQTTKADKVILWLSQEEFPDKEAGLPTQLLNLKENGLTIGWHQRNLRSFEKLIPALRQYPDAIIVTADDDILYPKNWLELLLKSYYTDPTAIHCHRVHKVGRKNSNIAPYNSWKKNIRTPSLSYANFATTGGGVLYPPHCLYKDVLKEEIFMKLCPRADDIWFWAMAVLNNTKIQNIKNNIPDLKYVPGTQEAETCLWKTNTGQLAQNDIQMQNVLTAYPEILPKVLAALANEPELSDKITRRYYLLGFIPFLKITTIKE
ncbi:MAG: glycosyltransferase [Alphaproteobacteria bacterium]|nr:glycosyltransferase [Alphaproteobacteria bacterium]